MFLKSFRENFFDTNVLVSVFTSHSGLCADLFKTILGRHDLVPIFGEVVLKELERVFKSRFGFSEEESKRVVLELRNYLVIPVPISPPKINVRDSDDAIVLATAIEAKADILVTGDQDLLVLEDSSGVKIVSPRTLWEILSKY